MATKAKKAAVKVITRKSNPVGILKGANISENDIRFRAYEIFQRRMGERRSGNAMSDWLEAERELVNRALRAGAGPQSSV